MKNVAPVVPAELAQEGVTQLTQARSVAIFVSGACSGNPGPGGWGAMLSSQRSGTKKFSGPIWETTSGRAELIAAIEALRALKRPLVVRLHTNSEYLQKGMTEWLASWKEYGWKAPKGLKGTLAPVKNADLWQTLEQVAALHSVEWVRVSTDSGGPLYAKARQLARDAVVKPSSFTQHFGEPAPAPAVSPAGISSKLPWED